MCYFHRTQMRQRWQWCHWNFPKSCTGALWFVEQRECNICSGACGLPELGSNCYIALTERRKTQPRVFVISEVCVVPYCRPTSEHGEETDVWTFAVKLSQTLCQRDGKKKKSQTLLATICPLQGCGEKSWWLSIRQEVKSNMILIQNNIYILMKCAKRH